jgi:hypothetical protein
VKTRFSKLCHHSNPESLKRISQLKIKRKGKTETRPSQYRTPGCAINFQVASVIFQSPPPFCSSSLFTPKISKPSTAATMAAAAASEDAVKVSEGRVLRVEFRLRLCSGD